jgi:TPR repeat protein
MILSKKYENKYIKYKSKYLKIKNLIQKGGIILNTLMPITMYLSLPLSLLAIDKSYFGMLVWLQLCNTQGVVLFNFVHIPQRVPRPFAGVRVYEMSLTRVERQRIVGCGLKGKLVRQLSLSVGSNSEPQSNWRDSHRMMLCVARRIASKQMATVRNEAAKEAEVMCALGQCAAALVPLQRAIDMGHLPSRALMSWLLLYGREGIAVDYNRAFKLAEEGTRLGCHHCQGVLAWCYKMKDQARSLELARESSGKGSRYGQCALGDMHWRGARGVAQDNAQAFTFLQMAAAQGLDEAQWELGYMYKYGEGVSQDYAEALRLFQLAAAQGHPRALFNVARCYEEGRGVPENKAEAIRWYRRALAAGNSLAANSLRWLEEFG